MESIDSIFTCSMCAWILEHISAFVPRVLHFISYVDQCDPCYYDNSKANLYCYNIINILSELSTPWPVVFTLLRHVGPPRYILASLPNCLAIDLHRLQDASFLLHAFHIIGSIVRI